MALSKKLATGTVIRSWIYDDEATTGQTVAIKNGSTGDYDPAIHIESVKCAQGDKNRIVIKRSVLEKLGFLIVEE